MKLKLNIPEYGPADFSFADVVHGYVFRDGDTLICPVIMSLEPGKGYGTKCIEALEKLAEENGLRLEFPNVISESLKRILEKRGYKPRYVFDPYFWEEVDVWERECEALR
ncbi:hypothetical protein BSNK01_12350 [Bacillaceae bacterium]